MMWKYGMLAAGLCMICICAMVDLKRRAISMRKLLVIGTGAGALNFWLIAVGLRSWMDLGLSVLPGIFMIVTSFLTREGVGYGDGVCLLVLGMLSGSRISLWTLAAGLALSSLWSIYLLVCKRAGRKARIPWLPFAAAGYCLACMGTLI